MDVQAMVCTADVQIRGFPAFGCSRRCAITPLLPADLPAHAQLAKPVPFYFRHFAHGARMLVHTPHMSIFNQRALPIAAPRREDVSGGVFLRHRGTGHSPPRNHAFDTEERCLTRCRRKRPCRSLDSFVKRKEYQSIMQNAGLPQEKTYFIAVLAGTKKAYPATNRPDFVPLSRIELLFNV